MFTVFSQWLASRALILLIIISVTTGSNPNRGNRGNSLLVCLCEASFLKWIKAPTSILRAVTLLEFICYKISQPRSTM